MGVQDSSSKCDILSPSPDPSPHLSPSPGPSSPIGPSTPRRRHSESSVSGSEYDLSSVPEAKILPAKHKEYALIHASNHLDLKIFSPTVTDPSTFTEKTSKPLYFVDNSVFTHGTPDVALIDGVDKTGPIIASAKFSMFSKKTAIGLGSPNTPQDVVWEELKRVSKGTSKYAWTMTIPDTNPKTRKTFVWTRTHDEQYVSKDPDVGTRLGHRHLKLIDEATSEVVALYLDNGFKSWKKKGKFQIWQSWGSEWELMLLLTGLSVIEKARRRSRARRAAMANGGGGGGGGGGD